MYAAFRVSNLDLRFLVDTGAAVSLIPHHFCRNLIIESSEVKLQSAESAPIKVSGECRLQLNNADLKRSFTWTFVVADVQHPIIGIDFLSQFSLLVDCRRHHLQDGVTGLKAHCTTTSLPSPQPIFVINNFPS